MNKENYQQQVKVIIESFTGQANILTVPRTLLEFLGNDFPATILLSQLIYWQGKGMREDGAIVKTYKEWEDEIGIERRQIYRATLKMPYLTTEVHRFKGNPTVHYYLDMEKFAISFSQFLTERCGRICQNEVAESDTSITETTTEITTETTLLPLPIENFEDYKKQLKERFNDLDFEGELEKFNLYWEGSGRKLKNPKLALLKWLNKAREINKQDRGNNGHERKEYLPAPRQDNRVQKEANTHAERIKKFTDGEYGHLVKR